jgi:hypothetical protein
MVMSLGMLVVGALLIGGVVVAVIYAFSGGDDRE